jgi:thiol-disulfide isomerase/thioredoxin
MIQIIQMINKRYLACLFFLTLTACAQNTTLQTLDGKIFRWSDYRGKWVLINYWASWCAPCRKEIPELNAFYQAHKKDVVVLGVNYNQEMVLGKNYAQSLSELHRTVSAVGIQFPVLRTDPAQSLGINEVESIPTTYLIDPNGKLQTPLLGAQTQRDLERIMHLK